MNSKPIIIQLLFFVSHPIAIITAKMTNMSHTVRSGRNEHLNAMPIVYA